MAPPGSIIVPVYNDPAGIATTLDSILTNTASDVEIIVVDNNSTDETPSVIANYAATHEQVVSTTERTVQSSYAARNTGIGHASGDIICFLDADVTVTEGWFETASVRLKTGVVHYLAPHVSIPAPTNPNLASRYNRTTGFPIEQFIARHHYAPTACLFVTQALIDDVGRFDERLVSGGDLEFGNRVARAGYELVFEPAITVAHPPRTSFHALVRRNLRIGRGLCQLQRYYPSRYGHVGIPPRPDRIRLDTYDASINHAVFTALTIVMTGIRGVGYYTACARLLQSRLLS